MELRRGKGQWPKGAESLGTLPTLPSQAEALFFAGSGQGLARLAWGLWQSPRGEASEAKAYVGYFECQDASVGAELLLEAAGRAKALGARELVGPLNQNTWHDYRLRLSGDARPDFLGEPKTAPLALEAFRKAGFEVTERYESRVVPLGRGKQWRQEFPARVLKRWEPQIRGLRLEHWEEDLGLIYEEAISSFEDNVLFSEISRSDFMGLYAKIKPLLDPSLLRLAFDTEGRLVGHVLAWVEGPRLILKNLACRKAQRGMGLAHLLAAQVLDEAEARGLREAIHALMHVKNESDRMAQAYGQVFREYALMGLPL